MKELLNFNQTYKHKWRDTESSIESFRKSQRTITEFAVKRNKSAPEAASENVELISMSTDETDFKPPQQKRKRLLSETDSEKSKKNFY